MSPVKERRRKEGTNEDKEKKMQKVKKDVGRKERCRKGEKDVEKMRKMQKRKDAGKTEKR